MEALEVTRAPARPQCPRCSRLELRGGIVLPAANVCAALDDDNLAPGSNAVIQRLAFQLAARGECPNFSPFEQHAGAYRTEDLPR